MNDHCLSANIYSQSQFCLICLADRECLISIFQTEADNVKLLDMLRYLSFDTSCITNDVPMNMCLMCYGRLKIGYNLKVLWQKNSVLVKRYTFYLRQFKHPSTFNTVDPQVHNIPGVRGQSPDVDIKNLERDEVITVELDLRDSDDDEFEPVATATGKQNDRGELSSQERQETVPTEVSNCSRLISRAIHQDEGTVNRILSKRPEFNKGYKHMDLLKMNNTLQACSKNITKLNVSDFVSQVNIASDLSLVPSALTGDEVLSTSRSTGSMTDNSTEINKINIISSLEGNTRILSNRPEFNIYRRIDSQQTSSTQNLTKNTNDLRGTEQNCTEHDNNRNNLNTIINEMARLSEQKLNPSPAQNVNTQNVTILKEKSTENVIDNTECLPDQESKLISDENSTTSTINIISESKNDVVESKGCMKRKSDENLENTDVSLSKKEKLTSANTNINLTSQQIEKENSSIPEQKQKVSNSANKKRNNIRTSSEAVDFDIFSSVKLRNRVKLSNTSVQTTLQYRTRSLAKRKRQSLTYNVKRDRRAIQRMNNCQVVLERIVINDRVNNVELTSDLNETISENNESSIVSTRQNNFTVTNNENDNQSVEIKQEIIETNDNCENTNINCAVSQNIDGTSLTSDDQNIVIKQETLDDVDAINILDSIEMDLNSFCKENQVETESEMDSKCITNEAQCISNQTSENQGHLVDADLSSDVIVSRNSLDTIKLERDDMSVQENEITVKIEDEAVISLPEATISSEHLTNAVNIPEKLVKSDNTSQDLTDGISNTELVNNSTELTEATCTKSSNNDDGNGLKPGGSDENSIKSEAKQENVIKSEDNEENEIFSFSNADFLTEPENNQEISKMADDLLNSETSSDNLNVSTEVSAVEQEHSCAVGSTEVTRPVDNQSIDTLELSIPGDTNNANITSDCKDTDTSGELVIDEVGSTASGGPISNQLRIDAWKQIGNMPLKKLLNFTSNSKKRVNNKVSLTASSKSTASSKLNRNKAILAPVQVAEIVSKPLFVQTTVGNAELPAASNQIVLSSPTKINCSSRFSKYVTKNLLNFAPEPKPIDSHKQSNAQCNGTMRHIQETTLTNVGEPSDIQPLVRYSELPNTFGSSVVAETTDGINYTVVSSVESGRVPIESSCPSTAGGSNETTSENRISNQTIVDSFASSSTIRTVVAPSSLTHRLDKYVTSTIINCTPDERAVGSTEKPSSHLRVKQLYTMQETVHRRVGSLRKSEKNASTSELVSLESAVELLCPIITAESNDNITAALNLESKQENVPFTIAVSSKEDAITTVRNFEIISQGNSIPLASVDCSESVAMSSRTLLESSNQEDVPPPLSIENTENTSSSLAHSESSSQENISPSTSGVTTCNANEADPNKTSPSKPKKLSTDSSHQCPTCKKMFRSMKLLKRHTIIHKNFYHCPVCRETFALKTSFKMHMSKYPREHTICNICKKVFKSNSQLQKHEEKTHNPERCTQCLLTFASWQECVTHMKTTHATVKKMCPICGEYLTPQSFKCHMLAHGESKCHLCNECFDSRAALNRHTCATYFEKEYKCTHCEQAFYFTSSLKRHMLATHGYKCEHCDKTFDSRAILNEHKRVKHYVLSCHKQSTGALDNQQLLVTKTSTCASANSNHFYSVV